MTRVWLSLWEWACCGDPFEVGDDVDFGLATRDPADLVEALGPDLVETVSAVESHHEEEYADRLRGRVIAAYEVTHEVLERRFSYSVDLGERPRAARLQGADDGAHRTVISRETIRIDPVPGTTRLDSVHRVPSADGERVEAGPALSSQAKEIPEERRRRVRTGWLVDVEEAGL